MGDRNRTNYHSKNVLEEYIKHASLFTGGLLAKFDVFPQKCNTILEAFQHFRRTGEIRDVLKEIIESKASKENNAPISPIQTQTVKGKRGRPKAVLQDSTQLQIKKEKISEVSSLASEISSSSSMTIDDTSARPQDVVVKTEKEEMPAPTQLPPRRKKIKPDPDAPIKRSTRTRGRKAKKQRDSDVEIAEETLPTIDLADSDDSVLSEDQNANASKKKTATRTKTDTESETESEIANKRPTRTRTLKKKLQTTEEPPQVNNEPDTNKINEEPEVRSTRTRTMRNKAKKPSEEPESEQEQAKKDATTKETNAPVRTTRTKTLRKPKPVEASETEESAKEAPVKVLHKEAIESPKTNGKPNKEGKNKRTRSVSPRLEDNKDKKKKSDGGDTNISTRTEYEDAVSNIGSSTFVAANATFVSSEPQKPSETVPEPAPSINNTVLVEKSKLPRMVEKNHALKSNKALMTDDESDNEVKTPPKKMNKSKATKEVFSPYEKTTLKKKVEAFEKLNALGSNRSSKTGSAIKAKPFTTPLNKFHPLTSSTSRVDKILGYNNSTINNESTSARPNSALKASTKEFSERQLREKEALKKKEAMLQAVTEEKKRKNQEKQLKAQQQRKVLEIEKQKQLDILKKKEEEKKIMLAEKEEYIQKQKEELEKVRQQKKQEMEAKKQKEVEQKKPIYLLEDAPLLPTDDCYDSDDSRYQQSRRHVEPKWCKSERLRNHQFAMLAAGEKIKNTLFFRTAKTPDLKELLDVVDVRVLKRNSSGVWRKPPRYTLVADLDGTRFSEDED